MARRSGGRDRVALLFGVSLLVVVVLSALTGKVLASNPPTLADSSPTADHTVQKASAYSPKPPDPESLFLDLPDPPDPPPPPNVSSDNSSQPGSSRANSLERDGMGVPGQDRPDGVKRASVAASVSDISVSKADFRPLPSSPTVKPGSGRAEDLLADPDCKFSDVARADLEAGIVDEYLISTLQAVCRKHSISVNVFKTGHTFGPGLEEGPEIPVGYGNAGGYPNTHYFGRAADIWEVDGKPVEGNGADPAVVSVGRILAGLPTENRPDVVIGPDAWNQVLGYGPEQGWVIDQDQVALHADHLHVGYWEGDGTPPPQIFLSPEQEPFYTNSAPVRRASTHAEKTTRATRPEPGKSIEPAKSPRPTPKAAPEAVPKAVPNAAARSGAATKERTEPREETSRLRTIIRKVQRAETRRTETKGASPGPAKKALKGKKDLENKPGDSPPSRPPLSTPGQETEPPTPDESSPEGPTADPTEPLSQYSADSEPAEPEDVAPEGATPEGETTPGSADATN